VTRAADRVEAVYERRFREAEVASKDEVGREIITYLQRCGDGQMLHFAEARS
jgi:hypothetical protein